jgi:hypothetical protein
MHTIAFSYVCKNVSKHFSANNRHYGGLLLSLPYNFNLTLIRYDTIRGMHRFSFLFGAVSCGYHDPGVVGRFRGASRQGKRHAG